ncbi:MAG: HYR domain-containing protein [Saprospiraceae bacterium]|nr:HYR domain-containing protein [Saprospiraceae bacterium]
MITIIENVPPQITCPGDTTVPCSVSTVDLGQFGNATASDNCFTVSVTQNVNRQQNVCGIGTITRVFVATDASGNTASCTQIITINNPDPLDSIDINWPQSPIMVEECDSLDPMALGIPTVDPNVSCYKLRITSVDSNFCKTRGTCEVDRVWTVFDSCTNNTFNYTQTIQIDDNNAPNIVVQDTFIAIATQDSCNNFFTIIASIADCDSNIVIVTNNSPFGATSGRDASGYYPVGTTQFTFSAMDACCNAASKIVTVIVRDTIKPDVTCRKVVKVIEDDGCADFLASEFILTVTDNCTPPPQIKASYNRNNFNDTLITLCCDTLTGMHERTLSVEVFFMDLAGNLDSCTTLLQVVDEDSVCVGTVIFGNLNGFVKSRKDIYMQGVNVELHDANPLMRQTNEGGYYSFSRMPLGGSYSVRPIHDVEHLNGVTTNDIVQIQRHILGLKEFSDPLKFIAADANNSGSVTTSDIVEIRKLILGKIDRFTKNQSWRFIQSDYKFIDPLDPLSEIWDNDFKVEKLNGNHYGNYTGIKIGDIDDSNRPNGFAGNATSRSQLKHRIFLEDQTLEAGKVVDVDIVIPYSANLEGIQAAFQIDPMIGTILEVTIPEFSALTTDHIGDKFLNKGVLLTSWIASPANQNDLKLRLKLQVNRAIKLSDILTLNHDILASEAYVQDKDVHQLLLEFNQSNAIGQGLKLFQNIPNPFTVGTIIPFEVSYDGNVKLYITDMTGSKVYTSEVYYSQGYYEIELSKRFLINQAYITTICKQIAITSIDG